MSTATETAPRPVGEKTVDLVKRRVGDPPYVGRHRRRHPIYVTLMGVTR